jgi:hypothetical protein
MRFTISLEDDLYRVAKSVAKAEDTSMSKAINQLIRKGLESVQQPSSPPEAQDKPSSFPISRNCRPMSGEEVYDLEVAEDMARWNGS